MVKVFMNPIKNLTSHNIYNVFIHGNARSKYSIKHLCKLVLGSKRILKLQHAVERQVNKVPLELSFVHHPVFFRFQFQTIIELVNERNVRCSYTPFRV